MKEHPIKAIRRASVPLVAFETSDPAQTIKSCVKALNGDAQKVPVIQWDCMAGQQSLNGEPSRQALAELGREPVQDPALFLDALGRAAGKLVKTGDQAQSVLLDGLVFVHNGHRYLQSDTVVQALWNLRDVLKVWGVTLVLLCPSVVLPAELAHDVVVVTEPLPGADEVREIASRIYKDCGVDEAKFKDGDKVVDTLMGVSAFAAEQSLAMSVYDFGREKGVGVDMQQLWERKRKMVEQTPGLTVFRGGETFDDVGGCANVKRFLKSILTSGRNPVRCVGFIDEVEKLLAGAQGDLSGVSQDQLAVLLREMQDSEIPGIIFIGPPGTAKSAVAKAAGACAGAEVLSIDTGAMTGSLVGESQAKIRKAMQTFKAVSQGKGLFIATCNKIAALPPELRRRFTLGTFFFDLPDREERKAIWKIWLKKYGHDADQLPPEDEGWTGAEIKACCDIAWRTGQKLFDAAKFVVPVCKSAPEAVENLRQMASGRFVSAGKSGVYQYDKAAPERTRKMTVVAAQMDVPIKDKGEE